MSQTALVKKRFGNLPGPGPGRPKGLQNKTTALLKDAILRAAEAADEGGMVGYLQKQAIENPGPFMSLLGKVLPMQVTGADGGDIKHVHRIVLVGVPATRGE